MRFTVSESTPVCVGIGRSSNDSISAEINFIAQVRKILYAVPWLISEKPNDAPKYLDARCASFACGALIRFGADASRSHVCLSLRILRLALYCQAEF